MHRTVFILFLWFTSFIAVAGVGTFYFANLNGVIQNILQHNNAQLNSLNAIGDQFRFLKESGSEVSSRARTEIMRSTIDNAAASLQVQIELDEYASQAKKYHFWAPLGWEGQKLGISESEKMAMEWLHGALISDAQSSRLEKSALPRPMENHTLYTKGWRERITDQNVIISKLSRGTSFFENVLIVVCFSALSIVFGLIYFRILRPMIIQFEYNAEFDERMLLIQKDIGYLNAKLLDISIETVLDKSVLLSEIKGALNETKLLKDITPSYEMKSDGSQSLYIEAPIKVGGAKNQTVFFEIPDYLAIAKSDFVVLANSLSSYIGVLFEINLRHEAETQRDTYHQIVDIAVQSLPNPIAIFDKSGKSVLSNPSFRQFFNIEESKLNLPNLADVTNRHSHLCIDDGADLSTFFNQGETEQRTFSYQNATSFIWTKLPIYEIGSMFIAQDITVAKRDMQQIEHENRLQELGRISGTVAHDSNNFLSVILNSLEFIKLGSNLSAEHSLLIDQAILSCTHASKMNKQLVSYASRQNLAPEPLKISDISKKAREFFDANNKKNIELTIKRNTNRLIFADLTYLDSAICNILRNSIESLRSNGKIVMSFDDATMEQAKITVKDNGRGFSETALREGTHPFYSEKASGSGLGLAAVEGFARQSGGSLALSNFRGAKVELVLPTHQVSDKTLPVIQNLAGEQYCALSGKTILLLEDNKHLGTLITKFFTNLGCKVVYFDSSHSLFESIGNLPNLHMIITDVILHNTTCFDVISQVADQHKGIKIFYITGYGSRDFTKSIRTLPGHVIEKPFSLFDLKATIESNLV